jgi:hypothetical protein
MLISHLTPSLSLSHYSNELSVSEFPHFIVLRGIQFLLVFNQNLKALSLISLHPSLQHITHSHLLRSLANQIHSSSSLDFGS